MSMTSYDELSKTPGKFLALTGYMVEEFQVLLPFFRIEFEAHVEKYTLDGKLRIKRRYSEYRNCPLRTLADKLLFILIYVKLGTIQQMHATLFGMHQPDANVWIHLLHPILNRTLAGLGELPTRDARTFQPAADALSRVPPIPPRKKSITVARKSAIPSKTSWSLTRTARFVS
jgi:hypothetical protein